MVLIVYANQGIISATKYQEKYGLRESVGERFVRVLVCAIQRFMSRKFAKYEIIFRSFNTEVTAEEEKLPKLGTLVPSMQAHQLCTTGLMIEDYSTLLLLFPFID